MHLNSDSHHARAFIRYASIAIISLHTGGVTLRVSLAIYQNISLSGLTRVNIPLKDNKNMVNAVQITVLVPRPWKVRPGQYLYLWLPQLGWRYLFQSHLFYIASSERIKEGMSIDLLIERRNRFSGALHRQVLRGPMNPSSLVLYRGLIEGPYTDAHGKKLLKSSSVLLFGNGSRIVQQLGYLRYMLENAQSDNLLQRRIVVVWSLEEGMYATFLEITNLRDASSEQYLDWFGSWTQEIQYNPTAFPEYHIYIHTDVVADY